jgi:hypothetical protein
MADTAFHFIVVPDPIGFDRGRPLVAALRTPADWRPAADS